MSRLLLALATALALAAATFPVASAAPPRCVAGGCVQTDDRDHDGLPDYANGAFSSSMLVFLNLNVNRTNVSWWGGFTFEEYEPLHGPDDKAAGADAWGHANLTSARGGPGFNATELNVLAYRVDHETGELDPLAERTLYVGDADRDGLPDRCGDAPCAPALP